MKRLLWAGLAITTITVAACLRPNNDTVAVPLNRFTENGLIISKWVLVGPFASVSGRDPWDIGFVENSEIKDELSDSSSFAQLVKKNIPIWSRTAAGSIQVLNVSNAEFLDFQDIFKRPRIRAEKASVVYAACDIVASRPGTAFLLLGSSDGEQVWLNGHLVQSNAAVRQLSTYDESLPVELREGNNLLLIKVAQWTSLTWGLTARLEATAEKAAAVALVGQQKWQAILMKHSVFKRTQPVLLSPRGVPSGFRFNVRVTDRNGRVVATSILGGRTDRWLAGPEVPDGIYRLGITLEGHDYSQLLCLGDIDVQSNQIVQRAKALVVDERTRINLDALIRRLTILQQPEYRKGLNETALRTEEKLVYTVEELKSEVEAVARNEEPFQGKTGLHIRGFKSLIDDVIQHYRIFIPDSYRDTGSGWPMVVIMPTPTDTSRPFLESVFMADQIEAERLSAVAAKYGVILLWSGYRTEIGNAPCEFTHFDEVLAHATQDYKIDPLRIGLLSTCGGSAMAIALAAHWPQRFSGVALLNPMFHLPKRLPYILTSTAFKNFPDFIKWEHHTDEIDAFVHTTNLPTYILHDGGEPGHGDLEYTLAFLNSARSAGFAVKFDQKSQTLGRHFGAWDDLFAWLVGRHRFEASDQAVDTFLSAGGRKGAIAKDFASRFVVITGSGGSQAARAANAKIGEDFRQTWTETQFGSCRVMSEEEFDPSKELDSNLVLVGNAETNLLWRKFALKLHIDLTPDALQVGGRIWHGSNLAIQAVLRDQDRPGRSIIFIGGNNLTSAQFGTMNLAIGGWFEYAVWTATKNDLKLVDAGFW